MVIGTNLMPTGILNLGGSEDRNFIQCQQLRCDTQAWEQLNGVTAQS